MAQSQETKEAAFRLFAAGKAAFEVERELGLPSSTARGWKKQFKSTPDTPKPTPADARDMQVAALQEQLRQLKNPVRVDVKSAYQPEESLTSPESRWTLAESDNEERIRRALQQHIFNARLPAEPVAVPFISDQHISPGNVVDMKRMRIDAQLIAETPGVYAILGGDGVDNHIKHRGAVMHQRSTPSEQYQLYEWYLQIFAHRIMALISGNHDLWTDQIAGLDVVKMISERNALCYAPDEAFVNVQLGEQTYKIGVRHQYRMNSSFNETHAVKQWWRNGNHDWDIGCIGHHHVSAVEPFWGHDRELWTCRPGSYQITSAYSRQFGYNPTRPMCPTFILYPDRREIVGFHDLRPALRMLKAERQAFGCAA